MTDPTVVTVIGEALVDIVRRLDGSTHEAPGGSPANVALTLGRLGVPVALITQLADDQHGDAVRAWLTASRVTVTASQPATGRTATALAHLNNDGAATYDFDLDWSIDAPDLTTATAVHVGSVAALLPPGADAVERAVRSRPQALITYDPNIRPSLITDADDARARVQRLVGLATVVKTSEDDLRWLHPGLPPLAAARRWLAAGPSLVAVTQGEQGAFALTLDHMVRVPAHPVVVVDTLGAGDTFMGTLIAQLLARGGRTALPDLGREDIEAILCQCANNAAVTVSRPGADPPWSARFDYPLYTIG